MLVSLDDFEITLAWNRALQTAKRTVTSLNVTNGRPRSGGRGRLSIRTPEFRCPTLREGARDSLPVPVSPRLFANLEPRSDR